MILDELNKKIADIESLANDKTSTIESKVSDLTDGLLMVADAVDIIPEMVDEKITAIAKEFTTIKDTVKKVKAQKGDNGKDGIDGLDGLNGRDGKDGSPDTPEQIASKLNSLEGVLDTKVLKDFEMPDVSNLQTQINTIGNQTLRLLSRPTSTGGTGTTTTINGLSGDITLSEGNNITLNTSGSNIEINADFTQIGKYMISGGITWSGTGLTYDVSFLQYFFNGNKTANPTQVTLDASDPTNNRFDAIVVDEVGTVTAITGTASANPEVPAIPEDQLQVTIILVAAGSVTPTIASEEIYMDDPTTGWTTSTYDAASPATGTIDFAGTSSPKQGIECIQASTDLRLGARFVRATSFDAYQYTMLQVWVRFTGTAVASNKSLNVRFENSAGTLVGTAVNLFNYGLQRGVLNTWQLVVVPITAFGALPTTVKGLKIIMAGGTVGVVQQWDLDYMILTNGSVPFANVPTIAFLKNGTGIANQSGVNLIEGTNVSITGVNNPLYNRVDYTINGTGGVSDGDYGDITVSSSGTVWTIDNNTVTLSKISSSGASSGNAIVYNGSSIAWGTPASSITVDVVNNNIYSGTISAGSALAGTTGGVFLGYQAGQNVTTPIRGVMIGYQSGKGITTGSPNIVTVGSLSGLNATAASASVFVGNSAGSGATNSQQSVFIGRTTGLNASSAQNSVFVGDSAGSGATSATNSHFIGTNAGYQAVNAQYSIFIGRNAGYTDTVNNTSSDSSILIGNYSGTGGFKNSIAIGAYATNTAVNQMVIGSSASKINTVVVNGTGGIQVPVGTTAERVATQGMIRYNTTTSKFEGYDGAVWNDFY